MIALVLYVLCIPAANWAISTYGVVPIGFGLLAPAGVLFAGAAFTLRDLTQERLGKAWTLAAIGAGALLSLVVSDPFVAAASASAFLLSELFDFAVYTPLRERHWLAAVALSNTVGLAIDSATFLLIAFGSLDFLAGQLVGKAYMTIGAVALLWLWRRSRQQRAQVAVA
jgi:queuosine precursor transporter